MTMTPKERMESWENLGEPKPDWETFKRMLPSCNNNPLVVRTLWIKKNSQSKVTITQQTMKKLYSTDYVVIKNGEPTEPLDIIYSDESIIEMVNSGTTPLCSDGEQFVSMTDLPLELQQKYLNKLTD